MRWHRHPLDASVGASGPHGFAVRKPSALVRSTARVHRILPTFVTIAKRPLVGQDDVALLLLLPIGQGKYFSIRGWTGVQITLGK